jgi:hypothetical protein
MSLILAPVPVTAVTNLAALPQGEGAPKVWQEMRQPGAMVEHSRTWKAVGKIMEADIKKGQPWNGPYCCIAMQRLEKLMLPKERSRAMDSTGGAINPGARDLALRVLQQLSRNLEGIRPSQLAVALGGAGRLGLRPAEGVMEALLGAMAPR